MVNKGRLKMALAAEKGVDFKKQHQKKKAKEARKKKASLVVEKPVLEEDDEEDDSDWEAVEEDAEDMSEDGDADDQDPEEERMDLIAAIDDSDSSDSEVEMEERIVKKPQSSPKAAKGKQEDEDDESEEDDEPIPMSDLEDMDQEDREDLVPFTRLTINNTTALMRSLQRIKIPTDDSVPFTTHQSILSEEPTASKIDDIQNDLTRELAFISQALDAAKRGRAKLKAENAPFTRPNDYFAEMVKDDGHMEKVKAKLVEQASAKKASAEARKQRDLKKFGKQVQVAKLQERQKAKKDTLDKIKVLKRKRQESSGDLDTHEADLFDVGVEDEINKHNAQKAIKRGRDGERVPNAKRQKKDQKYGFGGKKKYSKSGDAFSSSDLSGFSARNMKTGAKGKVAKTARLGKSRRKAGAQKR